MVVEQGFWSDFLGELLNLLIGIRIFCLAFLVLLWGGVVPEARGRQAPAWEIDADSLTHYQEEPRRIEARGQVVLSRPPALGDPLVIRADWMSYYPELEMVEARGNVVIESPGEHTEAAAASLHLPGQTGTLEAATIFFSERQLYIRGAEIVKTGEETYELEDAWFSACRPDDPECAPAWAFTSRRARVEVDGMAHFHHPTFQVKNLPLLYSPYLLLPAKTTRQSGFLFPEWSYSGRDGFGFNLPYFLNLSPSVDLTFHPRYLARRGLLAGAELAYAAGPQSRGLLAASFLNDRHDDTPEDNFRNDGQLRQISNRYWLRGKADHDFGDQLTGRLDLDLVSDQDFIQEFDSGALSFSAFNRRLDEHFGRELRDASLATRQSALQLNKLHGSMVLSGEMRIQQDSRHRQPAASPTPLQSLPRLGFSGRTPLPARMTSLAWDSEYIHYWRSRGIAAHRIDLYPRLIAPLPKAGGWLEGRATLGLRQTMYQFTEHGDFTWPHSQYQDRQALSFESNLATTLVRNFKLADRYNPRDEEGAPRYQERWLEHMIRPNLIYTYANRSAEEKIHSMDGVDRLQQKDWLTYELNNYLELAGLRSGDAGGEPGDYTSRQLLYAQLAQTYNLRESWRPGRAAGDPDREFSDLRLDLQARPLTRLNLRYQTNLSMYGLGFTRHELGGGYRADRGGSLSISYRYLKHAGMSAPYFYTTSGGERHDIIARATAPITSTVEARGHWNRSLTESRDVEKMVGLRYRPHCWLVDLEYRDYLDEQSIMVIFTLDTVGPFFGLERKGF